MLGNKQMLIMIWMFFLSVISRAQTPVPCGDGLTWDFDEETNTLFIRGEGKMNDFEYNGAPWNDFKDRMQHVVIEEGVGSIGARAFYASMIEDVEIPATVSEIGEAAFNSCSQLKECVVPPLVTEINDRTFASCASLTSVRLMGEVTSIGGWAFSWSEALQQLELPESVTHIGSLAFYNCSQLDLMLPVAVIELGDKALFNTATYNNENNWKDDLLIVGDCLVKARGNRSEYSIPSNIRLIANNAFESNTGLEKIVVPEGVEIISKNMFRPTEEIVASGFVLSGSEEKETYTVFDQDLEAPTSGNFKLDIGLMHTIDNTSPLHGAQLKFKVIVQGMQYRNTGSSDWEDIFEQEYIQNIG